MTTITPSWFKTFTATAAAIGLGIRVKLDSNGLISAAGATDVAIGTTMAAVASGGNGLVEMFGPTRFVTAGAAIARGSLLYPVAEGKVDDTGATAIGLVAIDAATADGDIIEAADGRVGS